MRSPRTDDMVAGMSHRRESYQDEQRRAPWRASTATAVGIAAIAVWVTLYCVAQANYMPLETAYQAHLDTLNNPPILQDPPAPVARAQFFVGAALVLAVPVVVIALITGLYSARNNEGKTSIRVLGWTVFGVGALGSIPALLGGFFGAFSALLNALTLLH
jgi:hypothetical protein